MSEPLPADRTEDLIAECLERCDADGDTAIDTFCAQHPESAARVRDGVARLRRLGLAGVQHDGAGAREEIPERLGDFRLIERIGAGGMGVVYLAEQEPLGRRVALKLIRPEYLYFPGARGRFEREIQAVLQLQHPGILPIYTVGETGGIPYFAMEWVDGVTLEQVLHQLGRSAPERLTAADLAEAVGAKPVPRADASWMQTSFHLLQRVAEALHHAHDRGVVHRDVKPSNILLARDGRVLLVDFGLALTARTARLTRTGSQMGSLPYMSPEQVRGQPDQIDRRTDVYSLGVVAFELLTLRAPYFSDTNEMTRKLILEGKPATIRQSNRTVPLDAEAVCLKAMDVDAARRYETAAAFAHDLACVLAHRPVSARRPGLWLRTRRFVQRRPTLSLGITMGALLFVAAIAFAWRERHSADAIRRLADGHLLDYLTAKAQSFWPARAAQVPAIDGWLAQASDLHARLPLHRAALEALRARAEPYDNVARTLDRAEPEHTLKALQDERATTAAFLDKTQLSNSNHELSLLDDRIAAEERRLDERHTWRFASHVDQWQHDELARLVSGLEVLPTRIEEVRRQREVPARLDHDTVAAHRAQWDAVIADIAAAPIYHGLDLAPQVGLVPWRKNPRSGLWEFWHYLSGTCPATQPIAGDESRTPIEGADSLVFVLIPGGDFCMGSDPEVDRDSLPNELPRHTVRLAPFFLSKYELTFAQWARLGGPIRSETRVPDPTWPAQVSVLEAEPVLARYGLDLPTEAQWECACRAGTTTIYFTGDDPHSLEGYVNVADRSLRNAPTADGTVHEPKEWLDIQDGFSGVAPVGSYRPNPFGLHDMIGNVTEWCRDKEVWRAYRTMSPRAGDGLLDFSRPNDRHSVRGGNCSSGPRIARSAARSAAFEMEHRCFGVRPVRPIDP
jgi:serine/threonine protein kinase/formylglycine-generating enzyme required for sulfatase activity